MTTNDAESSAPSTLEVEARMRAAYRTLVNEPAPEREAGRVQRLGSSVPLADLRAGLGSHSDVYLEPTGIAGGRGVVSYQSDLAAEDRDAAVWRGGTHHITISLDEGRTTDGVVARLRMCDRERATSMVAALDDAEVEAAAGPMGVEVAPGEPQVTRQRLVDRSVANADAWMRDAQQGQEDGTLLYRADHEPEWVAGWSEEDRQRAREAGQRLLERAERDPGWAYVRERAARWADQPTTEAAVGSGSDQTDSDQADTDGGAAAAPTVDGDDHYDADGM
jgi:hypothetical protein